MSVISKTVVSSAPTTIIKANMIHDYKSAALQSEMSHFKVVLYNINSSKMSMKVSAMYTNQLISNHNKDHPIVQ